MSKSISTRKGLAKVYYRQKSTNKLLEMYSAGNFRIQAHVSKVDICYRIALQFSSVIFNSFCVHFFQSFSHGIFIGSHLAVCLKK